MTADTAAAAGVVKGRSLWQDALRRLRRNRLAGISGVFLIVLVAACLYIPRVPTEGADPSWIARLDAGIGLIDPKEQATQAKFQPPGYSELTGRFHPFGTDQLGRDVFARCFYGGRISLLIGVVAAFISVLLGTLFGGIAGYAGGRTDNFMMRFVDVLYGVPYMLIVILIMVYVEDRGIVPIFGALALFQWLTPSRIVRGQVISYKNREFVNAATTIGASRSRILLRHLLPNVMGPVIVYTTLMVPSIILQEAFLSFLGLGIQEPETTWGLMAADGAQAINPLESYWWLLVFPALFLGTTLLAFNFLGDGLRDAVDPKGRRT